MAVVKRELLTKDELAERFGVDVRTVTNRVAAGMPERRRSGKPVFSWPDCFAWWEQSIRDDMRATRHAGGDEDKKQSLADARLRSALAEAETAELDLAARRGELVPVEFMRTEFERIAQSLRARLLSLPQSWAQRLGACVTTTDRQIELQDAINELMPVLAELATSEPDDLAEESPDVSSVTQAVA